MSAADYMHLVLFDTEMTRYASARLAALVDALEVPDSVYPSTLVGLLEAHAALDVFPRCAW